VSSMTRSGSIRCRLAEAGPLDELQQGRVDLLRGQISLFSISGSRAPSLLLRAARRLEGVDPALARDTYLDAWGAALLAGRLATEGGLLEVSHAAKTVPRPAGPARPSDLLLDALATLITDGREAAAPLLEEATRTFAAYPFETQRAEAGAGWPLCPPTRCGTRRAPTRFARGSLERLAIPARSLSSCSISVRSSCLRCVAATSPAPRGRLPKAMPSERQRAPGIRTPAP
jgi:hypothetical protein